MPDMKHADRNLGSRLQAGTFSSFLLVCILVGETGSAGVWKSAISNDELEGVDGCDNWKWYKHHNDNLV